eukprot:TRINITY_DN19766_c0_g1_i1.p1 TRINITY_DN19766_c0_g1~~TRINITY_DN19766_c0_g1_i1.p1  ORF type:complete len:417 (+),score=46.55 TRINITY_DN19766_c0_g1_i1:228-1478(+)
MSTMLNNLHDHGEEPGDYTDLSLLWDELRTIILRIYMETRSYCEQQDSTVSFERTYNLVYQLCQRQPDILFKKLQSLARSCFESLRDSLLCKLSSISTTKPSSASSFLASLYQAYEDLCSANDVFNGVFIYMHNCFMKKFDICFGDMNNALFFEIVYLDPVIKAILPNLKALLKKDSPLLLQYRNFEEEMEQLKKVWDRAKKQLEIYCTERCETKLAIECLHFREEMGESSLHDDMSFEQEHIHYCPCCCLHQSSADCKSRKQIIQDKLRRQLNARRRDINLGSGHERDDNSEPHTDNRPIDLLVSYINNYEPSKSSRSKKRRRRKNKDKMGKDQQNVNRNETQRTSQTLAQKMAQFSEFPTFWAPEEQETDPEQDKEVEAFRRRLNQVNCTLEKRKQLSDEQKKSFAQVVAQFVK